MKEKKLKALLEVYFGYGRTRNVSFRKI